MKIKLIPLLLVLLVLLTGCTGSGVGETSSVQSQAAVLSDPAETWKPESSVSVPSEESSEATVYSKITLQEADIYTGSLVLVNYACKFTDSSYFRTVTIYSGKNSSYKVADAKMSLTSEALSALNAMLSAFESATGRHDVIITSASRTVEEQAAIMADQIDRYGEEYAMSHVAQPGYSEHHTGLAADMAVYTDEGEGMLLGDDDAYSWIEENCAEYGIVRRYAEDKTGITMIGSEPWHFRYVGVPHSLIMRDMNFCLEEYITFITGHGFSDPYRAVYGGSEYIIYYVASQGKTTEIPLYNGDYSVSGDNSGGYIVTVKTEA